MVDNSTAATCTAEGWSGKKCSVCGATEGAVVPAKGHTMVDNSTAATCTKDGWSGKKCSVCGATEGAVVPAKGHTMVDNSTAATCTKDGWSGKKCSVCGVTEGQAVAAKGHSMVDNSTAATCTKDGWSGKKCSVCSATEGAVVPAKGHTMVDNSTAATCTKDGWSGTKCTVCGAEEGAVAPATGHIYGKWDTIRKATDTENGMMMRVCSVCKHEDYNTIYAKNPNGGDKGDTKPELQPGDIIDNNGDKIGHVDEDRNILDNNGNKVGYIDDDGNIFDKDGNKIGTADTNGNLFDTDGNKGGNVIGGLDLPGSAELQPGDIIDNNGNKIGHVDEDRNILDNNGNKVGYIDDDGNIFDKDGNKIGTADTNGNLFDTDGNKGGNVIGGLDLPGLGKLIPGDPNFSLKDYLDWYYKHVDGGDQIRPTIDDSKCVIGQVITPDGLDKSLLIRGAEDFAICPVCNYPMSQWIALGNGQHVRYCTNEACNHSEQGECPYFYITVDDAEYHICPVCGDFKADNIFDPVDDVMVGISRRFNSLYIRDKNEPFGPEAHVVKHYQNEAVTIVYAFTAAQFANDQLQPWTDSLSLFIPQKEIDALGAESLDGLKLVQMNREGQFEETYAMTYETFMALNADQDTLFLLVKPQ